MTDSDTLSSPLSRFLKVWGTFFVAGSAIIAALAVVIPLVLGVALWPVFVGAFIDHGMMPWEIQYLAAIDSAWLFAGLVWEFVLFTGVVALFATFGGSEGSQEAEDD